MLKITRFNVANFRSFKERKYSNEFYNLNLINVLTGENNTGKTNVLRALNLFFNPELYDPDMDRNYINKLTGGASSHPILYISLLDSENDNVIDIQLKFNMQNKKIAYVYTINQIKGDHTDEIELTKQSTSTNIMNFLKNSFKVVYLGAADDLITEQANKVLNDMILSYYKKQNKEIRDSITSFESSYQKLINNLRDNLQTLSNGMKQEFQNLPQTFYPELEVTKEKTITDFLIDNFQLKINDMYSQKLQVKGSGVQRSSIILMNLFLVDNLYKSQNTIILIDEPEAFLYPTLVKSLRNIFQNVVSNNDSIQMFLTTHSQEFISETNNNYYAFYNLDQTITRKSFQRSPSEEDIVKYSIISAYNSRVKNDVLLKYGLLDSVDDSENVIVVEGITDKNYLLSILPDDSRPQIRTGNDYKDWNYIGSGASGLLPILHYLNSVSKIKRNIFVLLDGDNEGKEAKKKILAEKKLAKSQNLMIFNLDDDQTIEDYFFSRDELIKSIITIQNNNNIIPEFDEELFRTVLSGSEQNNIAAFQSYLSLKKHSEMNLGSIKYQLSSMPKRTLKADKLLDQIKNFFEDLYNVSR
ncbi:ATP-dependent nuclease [Weissella cibaria]|uniref:ATP-dependent nuclease n=1 Tax=Weissella cibaria TaxID=137591 RepID=UPI0021D5222F|nr:AAA family ATPase [Weissella cibaria]